MIRDEDEHYLLDSNIVSELFRYNADFNLLKKMVSHSSDMAISVITLDELLYGVKILADGHKKNALMDFIQNDVRENFKVKILSEKAAEIHSDIQSQLAKIGKPSPYDDSLIAAIAIAEEMTLVTRNTKHFETIAEHFPLKLENWFEE
ncbi:MAG: PIN domain-containing protein [Treponema sp.]|nr:PIN domain-containing protein [Candidatus Treponema equifaecale]